MYKMITPPPQPPLDMQFSSLRSISPSFTSNSSNNLADIAARVVEEFRNENCYQDDDNIYFEDEVNHVYTSLHNELEPNSTETLKQGEGEEESESDSEEEFEFAVVHTDHNSSTPNSIFFNGEILQRYPLFDQSLLLKESHSNKPVRHPLGKLFKLDRETPLYSSSKTDELNGVSPGTYCVWKPKTESVSRHSTNCKKSNSTGSCSKRWRFRNLVNRSNSDISASRVTNGSNESVIVFRKLTATKKRSEKVKKVEKTAKVVGEPVREGERVRSYLPYKQDLVGVFGNVNGLSRKLHPF